MFDGAMKRNSWIIFLPLWVLANTVGSYAIMGVLLVPIYLGKWSMLMTAGFILGLLQWAVLGKPLGIDWRWALAGMLVYGSLNTLIYVNSDLLLIMIGEVLILGLLGLLQYAVLNEYIDGAMTWIFISPVAGVFGLAFSYSIAESFAQAWTIHGIVYGIITGLGLVILMTTPTTTGIEKN